MDIEIHSDITRRLETIKSSGLISDYWVSWVGMTGRLEPRVCSWVGSKNFAQPVREELILKLEGLVATGNIIVILEALD